MRIDRVILIVLAAFSTGAEARASQLSVTSSADSGKGSLRDALSGAKDGDVIAFAPSLAGQTITLTSGALPIRKNVDIEGPGVTVSGNDQGRVFELAEGLTHVVIAGLSMTHGYAQGHQGGGAILNVASTLTLVNVAMSANVVARSPDGSYLGGGAISNDGGAILVATDSVFSGNAVLGGDGSTAAEGGAIWNQHGSSVTLIRCRLVDNRAIGGDGGVLIGHGVLGTGAGGAIFSGHGATPSYLTIRDSFFAGNIARGGDGGSGGSYSSGFYLLGFAFGGAINNEINSVLDIDGTTFSGNQAIGGSGCTGSTAGYGPFTGAAFGGALYTMHVARIRNSSFDHNVALGGSHNRGAGGAAPLIGGARGGAIELLLFGGVDVTSTLDMAGVTLTENIAQGGDGNSGDARAGAGAGGGLLVDLGATATVCDSVFSGNQAIGGAGGSGLGGGIGNISGGIASLHRCALEGNEAIGGAGGDGLGGGIWNDGLSTDPLNPGAPASLTAVGGAVEQNRATGGPAGGLGEGGGVYAAPGGSASLSCTAIAENSASDGADDVFGAAVSCTGGSP